MRTFSSRPFEIQTSCTKSCPSFLGAGLGKFERKFFAPPKFACSYTYRNTYGNESLNHFKPVGERWVWRQWVNYKCRKTKKVVSDTKQALHLILFYCNLSGGVALNVWFTTNGMCAKNNNTYMCREEAIVEWPWHVNSVAACCHSAKHCAYAARAFRSQQYQNKRKSLCCVCRVISFFRSWDIDKAYGYVVKMSCQMCPVRLICKL